MAVYPKLLLSTGGGIISTSQQAEQTKNTATILIGLGGTGVHCIRTIKTQVYDRLKPDNPGAPIPVYSHIRFLGVDTTVRSKGGALTQNPARDTKAPDKIMPLSDGEFFSIGNKQLAKAFQSPQALEQRQDLSWLEYEKIDIPDLADAGAGGIRQIGRFMMMDRSNDFYSRLEREVNAAKLNLSNPHVNIHIFSGLSGGTGSGCFLDVCYMARSLAERVGGVTLYGYFFLPDVNLAPVPFENTSVRDYIRKNGYAAMQELDYCMQLQYNGGAFRQVYQGDRSIPWNGAPVDMCHLICATDKEHNVIENAYDYAMNVTAEYLMDFLTDSEREGLEEHLANFRAMIGEANAKKIRGSLMSYCVIGASCASVPLREINTYLASELFDSFSKIRTNIPGKGDVEDLAIRSLAKSARSLREIYDALLREIQAGETTDYSLYPDDWKFVRDYGNHELITHYTNQTARKLNRYRANLSSMTDTGTEDSLIGRIRNNLRPVLTDLERGPVFAYRLLSAAESHNLLNLIDGLITENDSRLQQEAAQSELRRADYEDAKSDFVNRRRRRGVTFDSDKKRFSDYEYYLMVHQRHELAMASYTNLGKALETFRQQVTEEAAGYYIKLARVMETLLNTFRENRDALHSENGFQADVGTFASPMMDIADLQKPLDEEIRRINIPGMLDAFMNLLLQNEEEWLQEDENRVAKLVTTFFLDTAFHDFAGKTITSFLRDKYETRENRKINDGELSNYIYRDWVKPLTRKASPLFYFNNSIWQENQTSKLAFLSFPAISAPIQTAARQMHDEENLWDLKESALTDRIFVMCSACGLPLSAYNNCPEYERMFYASRAVGRHSYEGKPVPGLSFADWGQLPSIMPQSVIDLDKDDVPPDLKQMVARSRDLYDAARRLDALDAESRFRRPDSGAVSRLERQCADCEARIAALSDPEGIPALDEALSELRRAEHIPMEPTGVSLPTDGNRKLEEVIERVREDHFVSSPAFHRETAETVERLDSLHSRAETIRAAAEEKKREVTERRAAKEREAAEKEAARRERERAAGDFADALFTGVFTLEGRKLSYPLPYGRKPLTLSEMSDAYPYGRIPLYQGFLSFRDLEEARKNDVRKEFQRRYNTDAPELHEAGRRLLSELAEDRVAAMFRNAETFDNEREIADFLERLMRRFDAFVLDNRISAE
ncbi:MAG: hypothetical protein IJT94_10940 [Oscillibacter sp.]|nr:hypothetical protein [Oscillibacter sp.]